MPCRYHYHLGFALPQYRSDDLRQKLAAMAPPPPSGDRPQSDSTPLFLCLILIAESALQHPFLRQRCAAAFDRPLPPALDFHFHSIRFDKEAARLGVSGKSQDAAQLIAQFVALLSAQGITLPTHPTIARPEIVIGAAPQALPPAPLPYPWQWTPKELALIEVDHLLGQQRILHRWTLSAPIQPSFAFDEWDHAA